MKSITILLMMLLILGCSSNWGTNSNDQEVEIAVIAEDIPFENNEFPANEIEPTTPLCDTHQFGFVTLQNPTAIPVRCVVGTENSLIVQPGRATTLQLPMGIYEVQWWPTDRSFYATSAVVNVCKSTVASYDPLHACKFSAIN